jgi:hypothetical protein
MQAFDRLMASAQTRRFADEASVDRWLTDQHIEDPTLRIAAKHHLTAEGLLTDRHVPPGAMATDDASHAPKGSHLQRVLDRIGIREQRTYDEYDIDALLRQARVEDIETRLAVKTELRTRGQLR